jgi:hypothetical protein
MEQEAGHPLVYRPFDAAAGVVHRHSQLQECVQDVQPEHYLLQGAARDIADHHPIRKAILEPGHDDSRLASTEIEAALTQPHQPDVSPAQLEDSSQLRFVPAWIFGQDGDTWSGDHAAHSVKSRSS